jgi:hypothetical protein
MTTELPAPVAAAIDATNAGDRDAFLAAFTADGAVDDWGRVFTGADEIGTWSDRELIGVQASLDVTDVTTDGDDVSVLAQVGGNGFNGHSTFTFALAGDLVRRMTIRA